MGKKYFIFIFAFMLIGCFGKKYEISKKKIITFKTSQFKFSDVGFLKRNEKSVNLQIYNFATPILDIKITNNICLNKTCLTKDLFNKKVLSSYYPPNLLKNVFLGKEIFNGKNKIVTENGFTQTIKNEKVNIKYIVTKNKIFFKDSKNKIIISLKDFN